MFYMVTWTLWSRTYAHAYKVGFYGPDNARRQLIIGIVTRKPKVRPSDQVWHELASSATWAICYLLFLKEHSIYNKEPRAKLDCSDLQADCAFFVHICIVLLLLLLLLLLYFHGKVEMSHHKKTCLRVSDQFRHKPACIATDDGYRLDI